MPVLQRERPRATAGPDGARGRPVMLATLDVPFDTNAVVFAVDSAVELGQRLIVANFVEQEPLPLSASMGYDDLPYPPEMAASLAEPVRLALSLGVGVVRLRVKSFRPVRAMVEVVAEQKCRATWSSARTGAGSGSCVTGVPPVPSAPASPR